MKSKIALLLFSFLFYSKLLVAEDSSIKVVPLITSTPLMGLGVGGAVSFLYSTNKNIDSKSQLRLGGQYSNTKSWSLFAINNAFFKNNKYMSQTKFTYSSINNDFSSKEESGDVKYNTETTLFDELLYIKISGPYYWGFDIGYKGLYYKANNELGKDFLLDNGYQHENSGTVGIAAAYDSRENKYYPRNSSYLQIIVNTFPSFLGAPNDYWMGVIDLRKYSNGFRKYDVWANQIYGKYASNKSTDSGLPTLSGKSILRDIQLESIKQGF